MDKIAKASAADRAAFFLDVHGKLPEISAGIVEKDFWVCWTLRRIFEVLQFRPHLIFKGGTSLSKVYRAIERFSEDVDLSLSRRDLGFADSRDPEQNGISKTEARRRLEALVAECQTVVREKLLPELRRDFTMVLGESGWSVELDAADPQTVLFSYPTTEISRGMAYVRPFIRLEMGARSDDWPAADAEVTPYAAEAYPSLFTLRSCRVRTLAAERTFWEKATLLHAEYHRPLDKPSRERLSRHYYDLYRLSLQPIAGLALADVALLDRVITHKSFFFAQAWAHYETARPGTFHLLPAADRLDALRKDYVQMEPMIFGKAPGWEEIVRELSRLETLINGL
jgi:Nucleotidyl transferase AbiEii toxin, Type IV TA system